MKSSEICKFVKEHPFLVFTACIMIVRLVMVAQLPIYAISTAGFDDALMVDNAQEILNTGWLLNYDSNTFVKGIGCPMFLALSYKIGIPYTLSVMIYYLLSCIVLVHVIKNLFKKDIWCYIILTILVFNPAILSQEVMQRVYRNGLTLAQSLFVFSSIFYMYLNRNGSLKRLILWGCIGGFNLGFLYNTREDGIWIMPFVIFATLVTMVSLYRRYKLSRSLLTKSCAILLPVILLVLCNLIISFINYNRFGTFLTTELAGGNFPKAMKSIYAVDQQEYLADDRVAVPYETLERIYDISPTMSSLESYFEKIYDTWDDVDTHPNDGAVESGWFFWCFRNAIEEAGGYESPEKSEKIYGDIHNEIDQAIEDGRLESRKTMPSALMAPWKEGYLSKLFKNILVSFNFVSSFNETGSTLIQSIDDAKGGIAKFEALTNNKAIYPTEYGTRIRGWIVYKDKNYEAKLLDEEKELVGTLELQDSPDVKLAHPNFVNSDKARFDFVKENKLAKYIVLLNLETNIEELYDLSEDKNIVTNDYIINIDELTGELYSDVKTKYLNPYIDRINFISNLYISLNPLFSILGSISYVFISFACFKQRGRQNNSYWNIWLVTSGLLGSLIVLLVGVAYNELVSCSSVHVLYLSAAYPIILSFSSLCSFFVVDKGINKRSIRNQMEK